MYCLVSTILFRKLNLIWLQSKTKNEDSLKKVKIVGVFFKISVLVGGLEPIIPVKGGGGVFKGNNIGPQPFIERCNITHHPHLPKRKEKLLSPS